jgi:hypothetical protein
MFHCSLQAFLRKVPFLFPLILIYYSPFQVLLLSLKFKYLIGKFLVICLTFFLNELYHTCMDSTRSEV